MPGVFLYFVPSEVATLQPHNPAACREWLRSSPVAEALRDCWETRAGLGLVEWRNVVTGPSGTGGVVFAANAPASQLVGYRKDQVWTQCVGGYWLGIDPENRPSPECLERPRVVAGVDIEMADGNVWQAPTIAQPSVPGLVPLTCRLPLIWQSGRNGPAVKIADRYRALWGRTAGLFSWWLTGGGLGDNASQQLYESAVAFLGVNYRVSVDEIDALGLFEESHVEDVVRAAIDANLIDEVLRETSKEGAGGHPTEAPAP